MNEQEMKTYYKLTDARGRTHGGMKWGEGVSHRVRGKGTGLCTKDVIHCYDHPLKAVLFNPIQANFVNPRLWEGKAENVVADDGLKCGCKKFTTIREIALPIITTNQLVRFAILCAQEVYCDKAWGRWAARWLSGEDRSEAASEAAWASARASARASWAAAGASAVAAARAAVASAGAAAEAAARASEAARAAVANIDFIKLIEKAIREET